MNFGIHYYYCSYFAFHDYISFLKRKIMTSTKNKEEMLRSIPTNPKNFLIHERASTKQIISIISNYIFFDHIILCFMSFAVLFILTSKLSDILTRRVLIFLISWMNAIFALFIYFFVFGWMLAL